MVLIVAVLASQLDLPAPAPDQSPSPLLPHGAFEAVAWCLVAGICEEVVYRGYLQQELGRLAGRAAWGVGLQAALFALAHSHLGLEATVRVGLYGVLLGTFRGLPFSLLRR